MCASVTYTCYNITIFITNSVFTKFTNIITFPHSISLLFYVNSMS